MCTPQYQTLFNYGVSYVRLCKGRQAPDIKGIIFSRKSLK